MQSVKSAADVFLNSTRTQKVAVAALMSAIMAFFIYRMTTSIISYDEQWGYNYYTDHPFYYSFFTYNSYPLFELTTHFFKRMPFTMQINLRLSPFIFGMAACLLCMRASENISIVIS